MTDAYTELVDDLDAEFRSARGLLAAGGEEAWDVPTRVAGWLVRDQVHHLTRFDQIGTTAINQPDQFDLQRAAIHAEVEADREAQRIAVRRQDPARLWGRWEDAHVDLDLALRGLKANDRLPWFGPPMSARSFATARLMEMWAHGEDIAAAFGARRPASARLRHVAHLGFVTRDWSYRNRGMEPRPEPVRVELTGPSGDQWEWGEVDARHRIVGPVEDFCAVVTQRADVGTTQLAVTGGAALEWMAIAQCFAGAPTLGPGGWLTYPS